MNMKYVSLGALLAIVLWVSHVGSEPTVAVGP